MATGQVIYFGKEDAKIKAAVADLEKMGVKVRGAADCRQWPFWCSA